ncbi:trypsin delta-like, partial [Stomoxys calcitrans]|uniref:Peptidase S1 domain-containing protein n=1 Tax=Stomoxys calcitrans TaxID=35570 RepID=A0A1I8NWD9_STOCA
PPEIHAYVYFGLRSLLNFYNKVKYITLNAAHRRNGTFIGLYSSDVEDYSVKGTHASNINGTRIIGGRAINIRRVPWQIALYNNGNFVCGGSLISLDWVLTAAHCIANGGSFTMRAGSSFLNRGGQYRTARIVVMHRLYNVNTFDSDIAMIRVNRHFRTSRLVKTISLAKNGRGLPAKVYVSGWGSQFYQGPVPNRIRGVTLNKYSRRECSQLYQSVGITITRNMVCAGGPGRDACHGDSGGPMVWRRIQYGIVSMGLQCTLPPSVYTNVRQMNGWIRSVVNRWGGRKPSFR